MILNIKYTAKKINKMNNYRNNDNIIVKLN